MMRTIRHMVLALCSVFILCGTVHAAESPLAVLQTQIDQILNVLKEPNYKDPIKRVPLRAQIEKYVHEIFDISGCSRIFPIYSSESTAIPELQKIKLQKNIIELKYCQS